MSDAEYIKFSAELLWWWLLLLAAFIPFCLIGIAGMIMKMRLMDDIFHRPPPCHPSIRPEFVKTDSWGRWRWLCRATGTPKTAGEVVYDGIRWMRPHKGA